MNLRLPAVYNTPRPKQVLPRVSRGRWCRRQYWPSPRCAYKKPPLVRSTSVHHVPASVSRTALRSMNHPPRIRSSTRHALHRLRPHQAKPQYESWKRALSYRYVDHHPHLRCVSQKGNLTVEGLPVAIRELKRRAQIQKMASMVMYKKARDCNIMVSTTCPRDGPSKIASHT